MKRDDRNKTLSRLQNGRALSLWTFARLFSIGFSRSGGEHRVEDRLCDRVDRAVA
jgi:hypothetical protein